MNDKYLIPSDINEFFNFSRSQLAFDSVRHKTYISFARIFFLL